MEQQGQRKRDTVVQVTVPFTGGACSCSCTVSVERDEAGGWEETMATPRKTENGVVNVLLTLDTESKGDFKEERCLYQLPVSEISL